MCVCDTRWSAVNARKISNNNNNNKHICIAPWVVTSEALGPGSVLVISRSMRESLREEVSL